MLIQTYRQSLMILQTVPRSCLQILSYFRSDASARARTPSVAPVAQSSRKPSLVSQLKWIYWCSGLEVLRQPVHMGEQCLHVAACRWILTKSACFPKRDVCDAPRSPPSVNTMRFMESSWICTSVGKVMVCAGLVLKLQVSKTVRKRLFPLKVRNGCGKKSAF